MKELTPAQVDLVIKAIDAEEVYSKGLKEELIDHTCCAIEELVEEGMTFEKALPKAIGSFGNKGLFNIERQITQQKKKKGILRKLRLGTTSIAACLVLLVLAVDAQERPKIKPLEKGRFRISSSFGERFDPIDQKRKFHKGLDMAVPEGTPVKATADGVILKIRESPGHGKHIVIKHDQEYQTMYANLSEFKVTIGQQVSKGDVIALSGNTGRSTAPHLHYEVIRNGEQVDPELYFSED